MNRSSSRLALVAFLVASSAVAAPRLINGTPVDPGAWKQVVRIRTGNAGCTASIVGPRALATAAHCAETGSTSVFTLDGVEYRAKMTRSPLYPQRDLDLALGVIDRDVDGITYGNLPNSVNVVKKGMPIRLMGYGCIHAGGGGGNDGILREGKSAVTGFSNFDIVTGLSGGSALCFGDSGGPAWLEVTREDGRASLVNISQNSKGDIQTTSYLTRWDAKEAQDFAHHWAQTNNVEICGIHRDCE